MDFFIKRIFDGKAAGDELIHFQFQKFGRGSYKDRALIKAKNSKGKYSIATTNEYANELVRTVAEKLGNEKGEVKGVVVSTENLSGQLDYGDMKQFMGIKQYKIDVVMAGKELLELCDKFPKCFLGLSFDSGDTKLKIKAKAPKSAKPSTKGNKKIVPDFCKIKTTDKDLVRAMLFDIDIDNFKEVEINHEFLIEDIILSEEIKDPKEMREKAIRKGKIIRKITIDGKEETREKEFSV